MEKVVGGGDRVAAVSRRTQKRIENVTAEIRTWMSAVLKLETKPVLMPEDLLTPEQLAERLQVPRSWIFEQTRHRAKVRNKNKPPLPTIRLGKYLRFSWIAVSEWLVQNQDWHSVRLHNDRLPGERTEACQASWYRQKAALDTVSET
jgi:hypothetical protein